MCSIKLIGLKALAIFGSLLMVAELSASVANQSKQSSSATFSFIGNEDIKFSAAEQKRIKKTTEETVAKVRKMMPELADSIQFTLLIIDRDLSRVNGTTGRADRPNEIEISFSSSYDGGISKAIKDGLAVTLLHELHHTVRGWTIYANKFPQGIDIAAINEGLADVYAEIYAGHPHSNYTDEVDYDAWTREIMALPRNANYGEWMFAHPDGREAIGYRTGAYLIKKAMKNSGKNILELSKLSVENIYALAGY